MVVSNHDQSGFANFHSNRMFDCSFADGINFLTEIIVDLRTNIVSILECFMLNKSSAKKFVITEPQYLWMKQKNKKRLKDVQTYQNEISSVVAYEDLAILIDGNIIRKRSFVFENVK